MTQLTLEELARKWDVDESLPESTTDRLKAYALLLAAEIATERHTVHSPSPVIAGDGFAEHMACILSERWSDLAETYVSGIVEGRYGLVITHDGLNGIYTVKPGERVWGGEYEDEDIRTVEGEGVGRDLDTALRTLVQSLWTQLAEAA